MILELKQPRVHRFLRHAVTTDRLPHGLLFVGPEGAGREQAALGLASCLLCEQTARPPTGCGECSSCRRVASGHHPDLHLLMTEEQAEQRGIEIDNGTRRPSLQIRVEQVRELSRKMRMRPYEGKANVAVVVNAHKMNDNAANALLKTLEEPGQDSTLILIAPHERAVLPTIASRCSRLRFTPHLSEEGGALDAGSVLDAEEELSSLLENLMEGDPLQRLEAIEGLGRDRAEVGREMARIEALLVDRLRRVALSGETSPRPLLAVLDALDDWRDGMEVNAHLQMALEELFLLRAD